MKQELSFNKHRHNRYSKKLYISGLIYSLKNEHFVSRNIRLNKHRNFIKTKKLIELQSLRNPKQNKQY